MGTSGKVSSHTPPPVGALTCNGSITKNNILFLKDTFIQWNIMSESIKDQCVLYSGDFSQALPVNTTLVGTIIENRKGPYTGIRVELITYTLNKKLVALLCT